MISILALALSASFITGLILIIIGVVLLVKKVNKIAGGGVFVAGLFLSLGSLGAFLSLIITTTVRS